MSHHDPPEIERVLHSWGEDGTAAMNGAVGEGVSAAVLQCIVEQPGVRTICDLGCGNGYLAGLLGAAGYHVLGIDGSARLVGIATANRSSATVRFRQGMFGDQLTQELSHEPPFDLVVSVDVIEHLYRPRQLLETAAAILKPGGRLVLCTPYHGYLKNAVISLSGSWDVHHGVDWDGGHVKFFSVRTLVDIASSYFSVEGMCFHGRVPWLWKNMILIGTKRG